MVRTIIKTKGLSLHKPIQILNAIQNRFKIYLHLLNVLHIFTSLQDITVPAQPKSEVHLTVL